jgi:hypothetical protein
LWEREGKLPENAKYILGTEGFKSERDAEGKGWIGTPCWFDWNDGSGGPPTSSQELKFVSQVYDTLEIESVMDVGVGVTRPYVELFRDSDYVEIDKSPVDGVTKFDLRREVPDKVDLVIVRDVFQYLPYTHVDLMLSNIIASGSKYLLVSEFLMLPNWLWRPKQSGERGEPPLKFCQNDSRILLKPGDWWPLSFNHAPYTAVPVMSQDRAWHCLPYELRATAGVSPLRVYKVEDLKIAGSFQDLHEAAPGVDWGKAKSHRMWSKSWEYTPCDGGD